MNRIQFYIKYIFRNQKGGYSNWRFYFPLLGFTFGIIAVILTFATMKGMEREVFRKIEAINFTSKILDTEFIKPNNENFLFTIYRKAIVSNEGEFRVINVRSIENFHLFKYNILSDFLLETSNDSNGVILGSGLAYKLRASVGDSIQITSPTDVSFMTGIPTSVKVKISGIFNLKLLNYDDNYIFTKISLGESLFKSSDKEIHSYLTSTQIKLNYPSVKSIMSWKDVHPDFISAMNLEKIAFSTFGFLIILLSAFSSFSIMCLTVIRRVSELGILRTLGYSKNMIAGIYFLQSLIIGLIGGMIGIIVSKIFIKLDESNNFIGKLFSSDIIFNFKLNISNLEIFTIYMIGLLIMLLAGIYPSIYASHIPILKSLNYNK
tara:strand:- start:970 stop:2100 length:1131 start_codon:yes stop_codon:yes gene_type:complete